MLLGSSRLVVNLNSFLLIVVLWSIILFRTRVYRPGKKSSF